MAAAVVARTAPPQPAQRFQGVQKDSAGYRLLSAMGWREGEGLGAAKQGIKTHIKVKKKFENWGVGAVEAAEHAQNWTNGMLDFHRVLSNLSEVVSEHARRRTASSSEDDSDASGGEDLQRPKQQPKQQPPQQPQQHAAAAGSKKRKPAAPATPSSDGVEEGPAAPLPKRVKAATHLGRFKKREAAKMVKKYSETDLAAILGADPFAAAAAALTEVRAQPRESDGSGYDSDTEPSGADGEDHAQGGRQQAAAPVAQQAAPTAPAAQPEVIVVRRPMPPAAKPGSQPEPQESRQPGWWQVCFHRAAGRAAVGAGREGGSATITIHGFSEQDQTNLYNMAQDKATQGRVGLGRAGMLKKVAGARWEGTKTRITDSDDDGEEEEEQEEEGGKLQQGVAPAGADLAREEGLVIILPASKRHLLEQLGAARQQDTQLRAAGQQQQQQQQGGQPAAAKPPRSSKKAKKGSRAGDAGQVGDEAPVAAAAGGSLGSIKWKKVVAAALKASSKGRLRLSKLHKAVVKEQGVPKAQRAAALQALTAFLQQSSKFDLQDSVVRAAA